VLPLAKIYKERNESLLEWDFKRINIGHEEMDNFYSTFIQTLLETFQFNADDVAHFKIITISLYLNS